MGKDSALYQLMDVRMNGVMNGIVSDDGEYQQIKIPDYKVSSAALFSQITQPRR